MKNFMNKIYENKKEIIEYFFCAIVSFLFLFFASESSPFYPLNNWNDAHTYFTIGKGMINGIVPYKDLFEQKGPLLYFIHAIAYLISNTTFLGVYILESISFSIFLFFMLKIIGIFENKTNNLWTVSVLSCMILSSFVFVMGDSAEEFCLPFLAVSMYLFFKYLKSIEDKDIKFNVNRSMIINGTMAGCVLWIKYTMLGFWIGFMIIAVLLHVFKINNGNKDKFYKIIKIIICFILGILITTIPWIIYFSLNGALSDFVKTYFLFNMTAYSQNNSIIIRILSAIYESAGYAKALPIFSTLCIGGYIYILISKKIYKTWFSKIAIAFTIFCSIVGIYYGSNYRYYFLFIMPWAILGLISVTLIFEKMKINYKKFFIAIDTSVIIISVISLLILNDNMDFHNAEKEYLFQYTFTNEIERLSTSDSDKTILCYGFIDEGFFTILGTIPNVKYFSMPNISYEDFPEIKNKQDEYLRTKATRFVITRDDGNKLENVYLDENYNEIAECNNEEEITYTYRLYIVNNR